MISLDAMQQLLAPLFPGAMGVRVTELAPERVVAEMLVRPDLCTAGGILHGGAYICLLYTSDAADVLDQKVEHRTHPRG